MVDQVERQHRAAGLRHQSPQEVQRPPSLLFRCGGLLRPATDVQDDDPVAAGPIPVLPDRLPLKLMHLLLSARDTDVLPAPSEEARLENGGQFGTVFRINFKGYAAAAKVCDLDDFGNGGALLRVAAAAAVSNYEFVLRLFDVALIAQNEGGTAIALIYPYMDSTLRTWCLPARRSLAPQEYRHIAWSMLMGIMHLHFHELVHSDLTPCSVQINGQGFGESADSFGDFCGDPQVAWK